MKLKTLLTISVLALGLGGCFAPVAEPSVSARDAELMALVPKFETDINFERYRINDPTGEAPGTIVIDTKQNFLYFVEPNGKAIRYGVAQARKPMAGPASPPSSARRTGRIGFPRRTCSSAGRT